MTMIKAVIYDMDGLIIDSEPFWRRAEIEAFSQVGLKLTEKMCLQTTGLRIDEVVDNWYRKSPWDNTPKKTVEDMILKNVIYLVKTEGKAKKGVYQSLDFFKKQNIKLALASSSPMVLINAVLERLKLENFFEVIHSAEFENYGKPHPGIFLSTAKQLNVNPVNCISIEDSINGIIAAKAAKMTCIAVPDKELQNDKRLGITDIILSSLNAINQTLLNKLTK